MYSGYIYIDEIKKNISSTAVVGCLRDGRTTQRTMIVKLRVDFDHEAEKLKNESYDVTQYCYRCK